MMPFEAGFFVYPTSTKDKKSRPHQFWTKVLSGTLIGYALNSGGGWTGDLTIEDWHDIENHVTSEVHVKSCKSQEVGINKLQEAFVFPCADKKGTPNVNPHATRDPENSTRRRYNLL